MYVIADLEWIDNKRGQEYPSQLAAIRIDSDWNVISKFFCRMKPHDPSFFRWEHVAFNGGKSSDFLQAPAADFCLDTFASWLAPDDCICWWFDESDVKFHTFCDSILKRNIPNPSLILIDYLTNFLRRNNYSRVMNPYRLCKLFDIPTETPIHDSRNDVDAILRFLQGIHFAQEQLSRPVEKLSKESLSGYDPNDAFEKSFFFYVPETDLIHQYGCPDLLRYQIVRRFSSLKQAIRKQCKPCPLCCKKEYMDALHAVNKDTIERSQYSYVFSPSSNVYHRRDCSRILSAKKILGTIKFSSKLLYGKVPCKYCHPSASDEICVQPHREAPKSKPKKSKAKLCYSNAKAKQAYQRFSQAKEEREAKTDADFTSETEKQDFNTLTQPTFNFWAGAGYGNFHLRNCTKLREVSNLKGFSKYSEAVRSGYTPCKCCCPSPKNDLKFSFPLPNQRRQGESFQTLIELCVKAGYYYYIGEENSTYFCLETPVGKWKIHTKDDPIIIEHFNCVRNYGNAYHIQPHLFLSLQDAFSYIKKHDRDLMKRTNRHLTSETP